MNRQRRFTAQEALRRMLELHENEDNYDDEENYPTLPDVMNETEDGSGDHVSLDEEEDDGDMQFFNDSEPDDDEDEVTYEANNIIYSSEPFLHHRRGRNMVSERSRTLNHPSTEADSFLLFIDEGMLRSIQRFTNRKAADIRRTATHVYK